MPTTKDRINSLYERLGIDGEVTADEDRPSPLETLNLVKLFYDQDSEARAGFMRLSRLYFTLDEESRAVLIDSARALASTAP